MTAVSANFRAAEKIVHFTLYRYYLVCTLRLLKEPMILKLVLSANERKGGRAKKWRVSDKVKTASRMRCLSLVLSFVRPLTGWQNSENFVGSQFSSFNWLAKMVLVKLSTVYVHV